MKARNLNGVNVKLSQSDPIAQPRLITDISAAGLRDIQPTDIFSAETAIKYIKANAVACEGIPSDLTLDNLIVKEEATFNKVIGTAGLILVDGTIVIGSKFRIAVEDNNGGVEQIVRKNYINGKNELGSHTSTTVINSADHKAYIRDDAQNQTTGYLIMTENNAKDYVVTILGNQTIIGQKKFACDTEIVGALISSYLYVEDSIYLKNTVNDKDKMIITSSDTGSATAFGNSAGPTFLIADSLDNIFATQKVNDSARYPILNTWNASSYVVTLAGEQSISGVKTFKNTIVIDNSVQIKWGTITSTPSAFLIFVNSVFGVGNNAYLTNIIGSTISIGADTTFTRSIYIPNSYGMYSKNTNGTYDQFYAKDNTNTNAFGMVDRPIKLCGSGELIYYNGSIRTVLHSGNIAATINASDLASRVKALEDKLA